MSEQHQPVEQTQERGGGFRRRALIGTILAAVLFITALSLVGDIDGVGKALKTFDWKLAPLVLALTLWNYAWRFIKWRRLLAALDVPSSGLKLDLLIYVSGWAMSVTPGKVGELIRSIYIKRLTGAPVNRVAAALVAERITDAVAMLLLALIGLLEFNYGRPFVALGVVGFGLGVFLLQRPALLHRLLDRAMRFAVLERAIEHARAFLDASGIVFAPKLFAQSVLFGVISWSGECLAFFFVLYGLGMSATWALFLSATFILAVSSLAGGVSLLPGGLGVTDATVAGMLVLLVDDPSMNRTIAAAATIVIRFATLWFSVLLGGIALAIVQRMMKNQVEYQPAVE